MLTISHFSYCLHYFAYSNGLFPIQIFPIQIFFKFLVFIKQQKRFDLVGQNLITLLYILTGAKPKFGFYVKCLWIALKTLF